MPVYEYHCDLCGTDFEERQSIKDDPLVACPKCGKKGGLHRLISKSMFVLQGGGWGNSGYSSEPPGKKRN